MRKYDIPTAWQRFQNWINRRPLLRKTYRLFLGAIQLIWIVLESLWLYLFPQNRYVQAINKVIKHHIKKHDSTLIFLKALVLNPRATGAVLPSSKRLAREMAAYIQLSKTGVVVELGAGTGVITQAILDSGVAEDRIIAVEYAPNLAKKLRERFPNINIIEGDAADLDLLLKEIKLPVDAVISGLPLRSLPEAMSQAILAKIPMVLSKTGCYIQFTYDIRSGYGFYPPVYQPLDTRIIWRNVPPAKINVFNFA